MDTLQQPKRAARDFKMTDEEAKRFSEQMKNPEFRGLLEEYMKEISDPTNKAENDKYLRQMESEGQAPEGQQLMQPEPAWVIKVKSKASSSSADSTSAAPKKVFINVCHSKMVKEDCYEDAVGPNGAKGRRLMMPYAVGERRFAKDNTGAACPVVDVVFNTRTFTKAALDEQRKALLIESAIEGASSKLGSKLPTENFVQLGNHVCFGGEPPLMTVFSKDVPADAKGKNAPVPKTHTQTAAAGKAKKKKKKKKGGEQILGDVENDRVVQQMYADFAKANGVTLPTSSSPPASSSSTNSLVQPVASPVQATPSSKPVAQTPEYDIVHSGSMAGNSVDIGEFQQPVGDRSDLLSRQALENVIRTHNQNRPAKLLIRIHLPKCTSAKGLELDISKTGLKLTIADAYALDIKMLPFPIASDDGSAKFNRHKKQLVVTVPVLPLSDDERAALVAKHTAAITQIQSDKAGKDAAKAEKETTMQAALLKVQEVKDRLAAVGKKMDSLKVPGDAVWLGKVGESNENAPDKPAEDAEKEEEKRPRTSSLSASSRSRSNSTREGKSPKKVVKLQIRQRGRKGSKVVIPGEEEVYEPTQADLKRAKTKARNARKRGNSKHALSKHHKHDSSLGKLPQVQWAQTDNQITVNLAIKGAQTEFTSVEFAVDSVVVRSKIGTRRTKFGVHLKLLHSIDAEHCTTDINPKNIILHLRKAPMDCNTWEGLEICDIAHASPATPSMRTEDEKVSDLPVFELADPVEPAGGADTLATQAAEAKTDAIQAFTASNSGAAAKPSIVEVQEAPPLQPSTPTQPEVKEAPLPALPADKVAAPSFMTQQESSLAANAPIANSIANQFLFELD